MDNINIGKLIGVLFLSFKFFIIPLCSSLVIFIKIFSVKNILKKAGFNYHKEQDRKTPVFIIYMNIFLIIIIIFLAILGKWLVPILCFSFIVYSIGNLIINNKYGNICGIYENGIVDTNRSLNTWKNIHSYKIIENSISGYFTNGSLFEYKNIDKINEIEILFSRNKVKRRED